MTESFTGALGFILVMLALGLVRVLRGPNDADRMMAAQLIGTGGHRRVAAPRRRDRPAGGSRRRFDHCSSRYICIDRDGQERPRPS